jgi:ABC-type glycerol-3-phosphate transport system substrate-binding protein
MVKMGLRSMLVMLLAVLVLAGCGSSNDRSLSDNTGSTGSSAGAGKSDNDGKQTVKIRFAHNYGPSEAKGQALKAKLDEFRAEHPEIEIAEEIAPGDELKTKLKVDIASDNTPDIFFYWVGESYLRPMIDADLILDMDEYFALSQSVTRDQWSEETWSDTMVDGKIYAIPIEASKAFFLYNREIFDKYQLTPPKTYEELKQVSKVLSDNGIIPLAMGSKGSNPGHWFFSAIAFQFPGGVEDSNNLSQTFNFDTEAFNKAAQIIGEMRQLKMFPEDTIANGDWAPSVVPYSEQRAAMLFTLPWTLGNLTDEIKAKTELMHFPKFEEAANDPATFTVGGYTMSLVINKKSFEDPDKRDAIVAVADQVLSDEMYAALAGGGNLMPAKILQGDTDSLDPFSVKVFNFVAPYKAVAFTKSKLPGAKSTEEFNRAMDELFAGVISPQEFISKIDTAVAAEKS